MATQGSLPIPEYSRNMRLIGHSDQGGKPDGVQVMVHRGYAYVGHMVSKGVSIIDVRDAKTRVPQVSSLRLRIPGMCICKLMMICCW